jgi:hypothetical protein
MQLQATSHFLRSPIPCRGLTPGFSQRLQEYVLHYPAHDRRRASDERSACAAGLRLHVEVTTDDVEGFRAMLWGLLTTIQPHVFKITQRFISSYMLRSRWMNAYPHNVSTIIVKSGAPIATDAATPENFCYRLDHQARMNSSCVAGCTLCSRMEVIGIYRYTQTWSELQYTDHCALAPLGCLYCEQYAPRALVFVLERRAHDYGIAVYREHQP